MIRFWEKLGSAVLHAESLRTMLGGKDDAIATGTDYRTIHERVNAEDSAKPSYFLSRFEVSELLRLFSIPAVVDQAKKISAQWESYVSDKQPNGDASDVSTTPHFERAVGLTCMDTQWCAKLVDPAGNPEVPENVVEKDEMVEQHLKSFLNYAPEGQPTTVSLLNELESVGWFDSCATSATYKVGYKHPYPREAAGAAGR